MKIFNNAGRLFIIASLITSPALVHAQVNPASNPFSQSIFASASTIPLNHTAVTTFELGNSGADPIPAGGATWNLSFPATVRVEQATLNLDGGEGIFEAVWNSFEGVTYLALNVIGTGIPAKVFQGPKTKFTMSVNITAIALGGPIQQTMNNVFDASISQNIYSGDDNSSSPFTVVASLPVHLVSFTATKTAVQTSNLNWEYNNAVNFGYFEIERSGNGTTFTKLGTRQYTASNTTGVSSFQYNETDQSPLNGDNYYRLKMVDKDGSYSYSKIVKLNFLVSSSIAAFPNPVIDKVKVTGAVAGDHLMLYSATGNLLQSVKASGGGVDELTMGYYANGHYTLKIVGASTTHIIKLVKQ